MFIFFFFFKQKTAYEMRISDWSSDVCSSDLDLLGGSENGRRSSYKRSGQRYRGWSARGSVQARCDVRRIQGGAGVSARCLRKERRAAADGRLLQHDDRENRGHTDGRLEAFVGRHFLSRECGCRYRPPSNELRGTAK